MDLSSSKFDVIIIGGGLAGLSAAIHLSKSQLKVLVIEKSSYPKHKVCGEYISNEVLPYLDFLEIHVFELGATAISKFEMSSQNNKSLKAQLPLGGFGISRYTLDEALALKAKEKGVSLVMDTVMDVTFQSDLFTVRTKNGQDFNTKIVIGAHGKRSNIDRSLKRDFIKNKSPYLAVKTHVNGDFPDDLVALHNFKGGYCGVSKVENGIINLCYITNYKAFKQYKDINEFQQEVAYKNDALKNIFKSTSPIFETPLTISQISFETKNPVENHILMCGDSAAMIHPLCGNGMSMAIRSAQIASELIIDYLQRKIESRLSLEKAYTQQWNKEFKKRLRMGHLVSKLFRSAYLSEFMLFLVRANRKILPYIIKRTHGKPMRIR
ncbi:NAD(P)/FAD-dependent oxidoreductase [Changchengzhania lutea]|uniref:NAD(P)/FAD-dependent oxidoreductase n=1 Tax=Changchengzhania lutea TaxID=2049305 RepID=UPI00163D41A9|nr:NAD(P)/FAD-dependent oxidoreductase [Changchengzhania lutea]